MPVPMLGHVAGDDSEADLPGRSSLRRGDRQPGHRERGSRSPPRDARADAARNGVSLRSASASGPLNVGRKSATDARPDVQRLDATRARDPADARPEERSDLRPRGDASHELSGAAPASSEPNGCVHRHEPLSPQLLESIRDGPGRASTNGPRRRRAVTEISRQLRIDRGHADLRRSKAQHFPIVVTTAAPWQSIVAKRRMPPISRRHEAHPAGAFRTSRRMSSSA